jgi:hypothetical protein
MKQVAHPHSDMFVGIVHCSMGVVIKAAAGRGTIPSDSRQRKMRTATRKERDVCRILLLKSLQAEMVRRLHLQRATANAHSSSCPDTRLLMRV